MKERDKTIMDLKEFVEKKSKEIDILVEENAAKLEIYKGIVFECFYKFWKSNQDANFDYLPEVIRVENIAQCQERLAEDQAAAVAANDALNQKVEIPLMILFRENFSFCNFSKCCL